MTGDSSEFVDDRPRDHTLDVGEESLRTQGREARHVEGSEAFIDDRDPDPPESEQGTLAGVLDSDDHTEADTHDGA